MPTVLPVLCTCDHSLSNSHLGFEAMLVGVQHNYGNLRMIFVDRLKEISFHYANQLRFLKV